MNAETVEYHYKSHGYKINSNKQYKTIQSGSILANLSIQFIWDVSGIK